MRACAVSVGRQRLNEPVNLAASARPRRKRSAPKLGVRDLGRCLEEPPHVAERFVDDLLRARILASNQRSRS
jgi:hypothetical protein